MPINKDKFTNLNYSILFQIKGVFDKEKGYKLEITLQDLDNFNENFQEELRDALEIIEIDEEGLYFTPDVKGVDFTDRDDVIMYNNMVEGLNKEVNKMKKYIKSSLNYIYLDKSETMLRDCMKIVSDQYREISHQLQQTNSQLQQTTSEQKEINSQLQQQMQKLQEEIKTLKESSKKEPTKGGR